VAETPVRVVLEKSSHTGSNVAVESLRAKVLLVQTSFLGDTVLSTPLIAALHQIHPGSELWMMATPESCELVSNDPFLTGTISFDKRRAERGFFGLLRKAKELRSHKFSRAYVLHRSLRTTLVVKLAKIPWSRAFTSARCSFLYTETVTRPPGGHEVERNMALLAPEEKHTPLDPELRLSPKSSLPEGLNQCCVVAPGSVWRTKRWAPENYAALVNGLLQDGNTVAVIGGPGDAEVVDSVCAKSDAPGLHNLCGRLTLDQTASLVRDAALVICNDSMVLHLASTFKVATVAVFCSTVPEFGFGPWRNPNACVVQREDLACKPCGRHGHHRCPIATEECMRGLAVVPVLKMARERLQRS